MVPVVLAALLMQIEVTDGASGATRSCGSVFDSAADRSGWELWWTSDLDEAAGVRSALPRTTLCPDAVNRRVGVAAGFAVVVGPFSLEQVLAERRSAREFAGELGRDIVGQLLWAGQGVTDARGYRTAPSAGFDPAGVKRLLALPRGQSVLYLIAVGEERS